MGRPRKLAGKEDDLRRLYHQNLTLIDIAKILGVSVDTIKVELDRLGLRSYPRKTHALKRHLSIRAKRHDDYSYTIGIIWGMGAVSEDSFLIRHKKRDILDSIAQLVHSRPYHLAAEDQWCLKIPLSHPLYKDLLDMGWQPRWESERIFPVGDINLDEFVRGYVSVHSTFDALTIKGKTKERLRIYGAKRVLEGINKHFEAVLGTGLKSIQPHKQSDVCHILYYQGKAELALIKVFLGMQA